ncbi:MAG TPA: peptide MFS transporter [Phycisphaerales bacterium]|nr:peptide MFS transporter [Phycisphaerales bacterium]
MHTSPENAAPMLSPPDAGTLLGHPKGLFVLFAVEMWERFSYYGMRALLVLYLTTPGSGMNPRPPGKPEGFNPGPGWSDGEASTLYGWYTGLAYLFPILGGLIADKVIGTHRSMVAGGAIIALGHVALAVSGFGGLDNTPTGVSIFVFGLALIVCGTGHFKPSVSVMVGQLYPQGDPRRDGAFTIFYMGINLGAFLCAFVCGTLGRQVGWHWGFGAAAVGMVLGLAMYMFLRPQYLAHVGLPPVSGKPSLTPVFMAGAVVLSAVFALLFHFGAFAQVKVLIGELAARPVLGWAVVAALVLGVLGWIVWFVAHNRPEDRGPVITIFVYIVFNAFFWMAFEQAGSSINLFTDRYTDRMIGTFEVDTTWFQSVNAFLIFALAPLFAWIWAALGRRRANPSQPVKIALGLLFLSFGFVFMVWGARQANAGAEPAVGVTVAKASMFFILAAYFWHTVGELCLSPTGLSYVTKAAPVRFMSLLMGLWFVSSFVANLGGGLIAAQVEAIEKGTVKLPWNFGGQADFFFLFVAVPAVAGLVILAASPLLKRMQRSQLD